MVESIAKEEEEAKEFEDNQQPSEKWDVHMRSEESSQRSAPASNHLNSPTSTH